jgi:hypothetical protein
VSLQYGYSLSLGSEPIYWSSKKQDSISLSLAKAKYRGVVNITIQAMWLQHFLIELGIRLAITRYSWIFFWWVFLICVSIIRSIVACSMQFGFNSVGVSCSSMSDVSSRDGK